MWGVVRRCIDGLQEWAFPSQPSLRPRYSFCLGTRAVLKGPDFFLLRTALKDRPKGPPTANRQPPTATNCHQPPTVNRCQPPPTTHHQLPTAANRCQPPPTAANHQLPTANRQSPPAANRQSPPTMVEHMSYTRSFFEKTMFWNSFFFPR